MLLFGKYTDVCPLEADGFPSHHFNFIAYNELSLRADVREALLTDYIGIIRSIGKIKTFGSSITNRILKKNIEIQNLNGNSVTVSLCNQMATKFETEISIQLEQPIIIVVSSCLVKSFAGNIQLSATPATSYYFNPKIPEADEIREVYTDLLTSGTPLMLPLISQQLSGEALPDEPIRIAALLDISLETLTQNQKFMTEAVIIKIEEGTAWYSNRCKRCNKNIEPERPHWNCQQPGMPVLPNYRYKHQTESKTANHTVRNNNLCKV